MPKDSDAREALEAAKPFIRSIAALLLYLRFGTPGVDMTIGYDIGRAHDEADKFLKVLGQDLDS